MMEVIAGKINFSNNKKFNLIGGINVLEDYDSALYAAEHFKDVCKSLNIDLVFKAS